MFVETNFNDLQNHNNMSVYENNSDPSKYLVSKNIQIFKL